MTSEEYKERRKNGTCAYCQEAAKPGFAACERCTRSKKDAKDARRRAGMCGADGCKADAADGKSLCERHLEGMRKRQAARRARKIMDCECVDCPNKPIPFERRCARCAKRERARNVARAEKKKRARREARFVAGAEGEIGEILRVSKRAPASP